MRVYLAALVAIVGAFAVALALSYGLAAFGIAELPWEPRLVGQWVMSHGVNILVVLAGALFVTRAARSAIGHFQRRLAHGQSGRDLERERRASTLGGVLVRLVTVVVWFVAVLMLLRELAIDVLPILTGAGIAGLAIGFGAQNLVRDVISGFFLILEDQVRVGDSARINGIAGTIEEVNLRTLVMRDGEGAVHVFPNGTVTALANLSKTYSNALVDVRVRYYENLDRVFDAIRDVGAMMSADEDWAPLLIGPVEVMGVESIAGGFATVRAKFKTQPLNQGKVANELRRRLVARLAELGVQPYAGAPRK